MGSLQQKSWARAALLLTLCAGLVQLALLVPHLPERVASHFDLRGEVDGWLDRRSFVITFALLEVFLAGIFVAVGEMVRRLPARFVNMPHREYWLAPEREAATRLALERDLAVLGAATLIVVLLAVQACYRVSTGAAERLSAFPVLGTYAAVVCAWTVWLLLRHARVPERGR